MKTVLMTLVAAFVSFSVSAHADATHISNAKILKDSLSNPVVRAAIAEQIHQGMKCQKPTVVKKGDPSQTDPDVTYDFDLQITCSISFGDEGDSDTMIDVKGLYFDPTEKMVLRSISYDFAD